MLHHPLASLLCALLAVHVAHAVSSIVKKGKFLYTSDTQQRLLLKGLAYQYPAPIDPASTVGGFGGFPEPNSYIDSLDDLTACQRDLPNFKTLGINAIRVYSVNPYADHSGCMQLLNSAGIYVISDLGLPLNGSIDRANPQWTTNLLNQYMTVIDNLAQYPNLLAVGVGNEVVTLANVTAAAAFVKAAARDIKAYIKSKKYSILTTYSSSDGGVWRQDLAAYLTCGSDAVSVDLLGLNAYRWCGDSSYSASGYQSLSTEFQKYPVPSYLSEYGCITATRDWSDVPVMFSSPMSDVWSGGIAFEYFQDTLGYGITNNISSRDAAIQTNHDFTLLAQQYSNLTLPTTPSFANAPAATYPACAADGSQGDDFLASSTLPPTPDATVCQCLTSQALPCLISDTATPAIVGELLDYTCSLLGGQNNTSCDDIKADGHTGTYGKISYCSPSDKLNYVMSQYYLSQNNTAQACSFSNNATVSPYAPATKTLFDSAVSSCLAESSGKNNNGVFTPSAVPASSASSLGGSGSGSSGNGSKNAKSNATPLALSLMGLTTVFMGLLGAIFVAV